MNRITLFFYNLFFVPILLVLLPGYLLRIRKRGGYGHKAAQRLGIIGKQTVERIGTGRIWLHAVSVGEVGIALKFAATFRQRNPEARFLVSSTTSTGLAILEQSASEWLEPMANPIDLPLITSWLMRRLKPAAMLMVEADLWPNRMAACCKERIPMALINARLSVRSERRFRRVRFLASPFFNQLNLITLTGPEDLKRWLSLGTRRETLHWTGNIKYDTSTGNGNIHGKGATPALPPTLEWSATDPLFLAASTHEGEEAEIARAFLALRNDFPSLRLVIAPRHVERRSEIRAQLHELGLSCSLRSEGASAPADLLLLDTTGELSGWYPLASIVFVGKSLPSSVNKGGQNMIEPLQAGCPVLIGPHTGNFEPLATRLCDAGSATRVMHSADIAKTAGDLLMNENQRSATVQSAENVLKPHQGATERNCQLVERMVSGSPLQHS